MLSTTSQSDYGLLPTAALPASMTVLFGSIKRTGRVTMPPELHLKAAFGELKLDLTEALFPDRHMLLVAESLCASVEVLLPEGAIVEDHSTSIASSQKLSHESHEHGPVIHLDGWSLFSSVKFTTARADGRRSTVDRRNRRLSWPSYRRRNPRYTAQTLTCRHPSTRCSHSPVRFHQWC
jgi:hypothetical protein